MTPTDRNDDGFTLVELLVSVAIMGVIMAAISTAFIGFLQTGAKTSARDDHSAGGALLASYLDRDLASAEEYSTTGTGCPVTNPAAGSPQLRLAWTEQQPHPNPAVLALEAGGTWKVTYAVTLQTPSTPASSLRQLVRRLCAPSGNEQTVLLSSLAPGTVLSSASTGSCARAGSTRVVIGLPSYSDDTTEPYRYGGCVKGRLG